jgi:hypothetical protein
MDVVFTVVPFADVARPAIGVSLLKAGLARVCYASVQDLNLDFAALIGSALYQYFCDDIPTETMAGEWFFADLLFAGQIPPPHEFADDVLRPVIPPDMLKGLDAARAARAAFVDKRHHRQRSVARFDRAGIAGRGRQLR